MATIAELADAVDAARKELEAVSAQESEARRKATEARNVFNRATQAFDAAVVEMRAQAPWDTDWSRAEDD